MKKTFKIEFSSFMTKKEKEILKLILDSYIYNKDLEFNILYLNIPKIKNEELNFIERFAKKGFWLIEDEKKQYVNYFSSIFLEKDRVNFQLNEVFLRFINEKRLITNYSLYDFLFLKHTLTLEFFFKYMLKYFEEKSFEIPLVELKHNLGVENYSRMYDLDRYVFELIKEDINKNTQFYIEYVKKKTLGKVESIRFNIINKKNIEIRTIIKMLLFLFKKYIKNRELFIKIIEKQLQIYDYSKIKVMINLAIDLLPNFDYNFEKSLIFVIERGYTFEYILIKKNIYEFGSYNDIFKFIFKDIQFYLKDDDEIFSHIFSDKLMKKIYNLKEGNLVTVKTEKSKLELKFEKGNFYMDMYSKRDVFKN